MFKPNISFERHDLETVLKAGREMDHYALRDRLVVDFGDRPFFAPFSMLFVGAKLGSLKRANPKLKIDIKDYKSLDYAARSGFFDLAGIDYGNQIGQTSASGDYLPITRITRSELEDSDEDKFAQVQDLIQRHAERVASVLTRETEQHRDLNDALSYSIREMMRNVVEHSQAVELYYCAQYWKKSNRVEFAMVDFGVGICRALSENPNFRGLSQREALNMSLMPGVSGKTHKGDRSSTWHNSGYGLYMTNRLARNGGGNFVIASGDHSIHLGPKSKTDHSTSFPGTAIRFNLHAARIGDVSAKLGEFRKDAARLAPTLKGAGNRPPSSMSMILRKDYERPVPRKNV